MVGGAHCHVGSRSQAASIEVRHAPNIAVTWQSCDTARGLPLPDLCDCDADKGLKMLIFRT